LLYSRIEREVTMRTNPIRILVALAAMLALPAAGHAAQIARSSAKRIVSKGAAEYIHQPYRKFNVVLRVGTVAGPTEAFNAAPRPARGVGAPVVTGLINMEKGAGAPRGAKRLTFTSPIPRPSAPTQPPNL
jgi:hypothetical protein